MLSSAPRREDTRHVHDQPVYGSSLAQLVNDDRSYDGDNDEVVHALYAVLGRCPQSVHVQCAMVYADGCGCDDAYDKNPYHIHASQGKCKDKEIRQDVQNIPHLGCCLCLHAVTEKQVCHDGEHGCRKGNAYVGTELVGHAAALGLGGHDGGVGDEGEVVAEQAASHNNSRGHGDTGRSGVGYSHGNGYQGGNGATTGAYAQ